MLVGLKYWLTAVSLSTILRTSAITLTTNKRGDMAERKYCILTQNEVGLWVQQDFIEASGPTVAARVYVAEKFGVQAAVVRLSGLPGQSGLFRTERYEAGSEPEAGSWAPLAAPFFVL